MPDPNSGHLINEATKTPRTDMAKKMAHYRGLFNGNVLEADMEYVEVGVAAQLEIELNAAIYTIESMKCCSNCGDGGNPSDWFEYCNNENNCRRTLAWRVKGSIMPKTIASWDDMWKPR